VKTGVSPDRLIELAGIGSTASRTISPQQKTGIADKAPGGGEAAAASTGPMPKHWLSAACLPRAPHPAQRPGRAAGEPSASATACCGYENGAPHPPDALPGAPRPTEVHNSLLAEFSVLGFEYGYAVTRPDVLTIWEAQFGDFANNAQCVIDLFIASGEAKWQRYCGLVLLLPHGWEGLGPEHSSARLERFLQLCAQDNMQVCYPTTPAQYFHLLRRQITRKPRKPLVVMTPKSLLRHPMAVSTLGDLSAGGFKAVIDDAGKGTARPNSVIFCSGKDLLPAGPAQQMNSKNPNAHHTRGAVLPLPRKGGQGVIGRYKKANLLGLGAGRAGEHGRLAVHPAEAVRPAEKPLAYVGETHRPARLRDFPRSTKWSRTAL
jgi:2-oxoglutarate dehydrogenase complex dehydrogenase (E1) component-like enzyme